MTQHHHPLPPSQRSTDPPPPPPPALCLCTRPHPRLIINHDGTTGGDRAERAAGLQLPGLAAQEELAEHQGTWALTTLDIDRQAVQTVRHGTLVSFKPDVSRPIPLTVSLPLSRHAWSLWLSQVLYIKSTMGPRQQIYCTYSSTTPPPRPRRTRVASCLTLLSLFFLRACVNSLNAVTNRRSMGRGGRWWWMWWCIKIWQS